jgi:hypothetical protein
MDMFILHNTLGLRSVRVAWAVSDAKIKLSSLTQPGGALSDGYPAIRLYIFIN